MQNSGVGNPKALERHIKRHVLAGEHRIAAVTPPEFASLCEKELRDIGFEELSLTDAGVEFSAKLTESYLCNLWLRTASRILCRVVHFRSGAVEQLFSRVSAFRWELWLNPAVPLHIDVHVRQSRIQHEGLIEKTVFMGIQKRFADAGLGQPAQCRSLGELSSSQSKVVQRIIVRLINNYCEISLDTSGNHLHQRGYRLIHSGAPLRETLAAAILMKAGWRRDRPIIDGMCGSGTMTIEASLLAKRLPPGFMRRFLFEQWPSFQERTWRYSLRKASDGVQTKSPVPIIAIDDDPEAMAVSKQNAERAKVAGDIMWHQTDFFSVRPQTMNLDPGLLFLNPPYGRRLEREDGLYERLGVHLRQFFRGWQIAIIAPDRVLANGLKFNRARYWHVKHGGMPVTVVFARL